jgi:hypothetical protein
MERVVDDKKNSLFDCEKCNSVKSVRIETQLWDKSIRRICQKGCGVLSGDKSDRGSGK